MADETELHIRGYNDTIWGKYGIYVNLSPGLEIPNPDKA